MKNHLLKIFVIIFIGINQVLMAQMAPPSPSSRPGGGAGGVGPGGRPKNPIDMYEGLLVIAAIVLIVYFYKQSKKLKMS